GRVSLVDGEGNVLLEDDFTGPVTAAIDSRSVGFVSPGDYTKLALKAVLHDDAGNLMDEVELLYDYTKFLNIERQFSITAPAKVSEAVAFEVRYVDVYGDSLSGDFVVYLTSPEGKVVRMEEGRVSGSFKGEFTLEGLPGGSYVLKAVEKEAHLSDEMTVDVENVEETIPTTTTTMPEPASEMPAEEEPEQGFPWMPVIAVLIVAIVVLFILTRRNK
ncbi:MAG: hypothetical protein JW724_03305, partial [Candidatus Altiarchaeota archaeon]|nr:hypothetical protein [Candidatus Altiarchaeota archaeon]